MSYLEIELTAVDWRNEPPPNQPALHVVGEDDLELPVEEEATPAATPQVTTYPITVNIDDIREYYPRRPRNGVARTGTRLVFKNGAGRPVQEVYADVRAKIAAVLA
jgi:hypothetical protein